MAQGGGSAYHLLSEKVRVREHPQQGSRDLRGWRALVQPRRCPDPLGDSTGFSTLARKEGVGGEDRRRAQSRQPGMQARGANSVMPLDSPHPWPRAASPSHLRTRDLPVTWHCCGRAQVIPARLALDSLWSWHRDTDLGAFPPVLQWYPVVLVSYLKCQNLPQPLGSGLRNLPAADKH